jgi:hypothetical protein
VSFWVAQTSYEMYEKRQNPGALATIWMLSDKKNTTPRKLDPSGM